MRVNQTSRFVAATVLRAMTAVAFIDFSHRHDVDVVAAQGSSGGAAPVLKVDEYYPVKTDWIGSDRSIRTINHRPTGSCYLLVFPSGDSLLPVEKERCATTSAVER